MLPESDYYVIIVNRMYVKEYYTKDDFLLYGQQVVGAKHFSALKNAITLAREISKKRNGVRIWHFMNNEVKDW